MTHVKKRTDADLFAIHPAASSVDARPASADAPSGAVILVTARVLDIRHGTELGTIFLVSHDLLSPDDPIEATRAAGCLLTPERGDLVLIALPADETRTVKTYILSVLERDAARVATVSTGGGEAVTIAAQSVTLAAAEAVALKGRTLTAEAEKGHVKITALSVIADKVSAVLQRCETAVRTLIATADRSVSSARVSLRQVKDSDTLNAGQIIHRADETMVLESTNTVVEAHKHIRIDGEQISMG